MLVKDKLKNSKKILRDLFMGDMKFSGKNVPIKDIAKLIGKDQQFIRQGIINGKLQKMCEKPTPLGVGWIAHFL